MCVCQGWMGMSIVSDPVFPSVRTHTYAHTHALFLHACIAVSASPSSSAREVPASVTVSLPAMTSRTDGVKCSLTNFKTVTPFQLCCSLFIRRKPVLQVQVQIYHCCNREQFICDNSALVLSRLFFPVSLSPLSPNSPCPGPPPPITAEWSCVGLPLVATWHKGRATNTPSHLLIPPEIFPSFFLGDKLSKDCPKKK